jgi:hypothetical protein
MIRCKIELKAIPPLSNAEAAEFERKNKRQAGAYKCIGLAMANLSNQCDMPSSAWLCFDDACKALENSNYESAMQNALKSLAYSASRNSAAYRECAQIIEAI